MFLTRYFFGKVELADPRAQQRPSQYAQHFVSETGERLWMQNISTDLFQVPVLLASFSSDSKILLRVLDLAI